MSDPPNILIFGFGAVGATYGLFLHRAACTITAVCRTNFSAVKSNGVLIRSPLFGHQRYHPRAVQTVAEAATSPDPDGAVAKAVEYDYVIVASKAFPGTADLIREAVTPGKTAIVLAQNGIGIESDYARLYPSNTIISGVVYLPVTQVSPGEIEHATPLQRFEIGPYPADTSDTSAHAQTKALSDLWSKGGADAPVFADVQPTKWKKLAINAAWNPITALTLCDDANYIRSGPASEDAIRSIMTEVGLVATASGCPDVITPEFIESDLERPRARLATGGKQPSMLVDVHMGRRIEVEAILGNVVRMGEKLGVDTPGLRLLYALAKARDFALAKPEGEEGWKPIARH